MAGRSERNALRRIRARSRFHERGRACLLYYRSESLPKRGAQGRSKRQGGRRRRRRLIAHAIASTPNRGRVLDSEITIRRIDVIVRIGRVSGVVVEVGGIVPHIAQVAGGVVAK